MGMTERERVLDAFRNCITEPKCKDCPWDECSTLNNGIVEIPRDLALAVMRELVARVMTLEEVAHFVYGSPYILERVLSDGEHRMMYGLYSHKGVGGNFDFTTVGERIRLYDVDYGKTWRCWTSRPTYEQREAMPWE